MIRTNTSSNRSSTHIGNNYLQSSVSVFSSGVLVIFNICKDTLKMVCILLILCTALQLTVTTAWESNLNLEPTATVQSVGYDTSLTLVLSESGASEEQEETTVVDFTREDLNSDPGITEAPNTRINLNSNLGIVPKRSGKIPPKFIPLIDKENLNGESNATKKSCSSKENCSFNENCVDGFCAVETGKIVRNCKEKSDCHHAEACVQNVCQPLDISCQFPSDYWDGNKCQNVTDYHSQLTSAQPIDEDSNIITTEKPALFVQAFNKDEITEVPIKDEDEPTITTETGIAPFSSETSAQDHFTDLEMQMVRANISGAGNLTSISNSNSSLNTNANTQHEKANPPKQWLRIFETFTERSNNTNEDIVEIQNSTERGNIHFSDESNENNNNNNSTTAYELLKKMAGDSNSSITKQQRALFSSSSLVAEIENTDTEVDNEKETTTVPDQDSKIAPTSPLTTIMPAQNSTIEIMTSTLAPTTTKVTTARAQEKSNANKSTKSTSTVPPGVKQCSTKYDCETTEACVNGTCALDAQLKKCLSSTDCAKWEACTGNVCHALENRCPAQDEYWDGDKCERLPDVKTAEIIISIVALVGLLAAFVLVGVLVRNGCLPTTGFSYSRSIRRTKRPKNRSESEYDYDDPRFAASVDQGTTGGASNSLSKSRSRSRPKPRSRSQSVPNLGEVNFP